MRLHTHLASSPETTQGQKNLKIQNLLPINLTQQRSSATKSSIDVTVTSSNGTDISSQIKTMIYREPKIVADNDLNSRGLTPGLSRPQNACPVRDGDSYAGRFAYSHCEHDGGVSGSLQRFIIYCYPPRVKDTAGSSSDSDSSDGRKPSKMPFGQVGMCQQNEICVNGRGVGNHFDRKKIRANPDAQVAQCISHQYFVEMAQESSTAPPSGLQLEGERASMVFSSMDAKTPLKVQEMDWLATGTSVSSGQQTKGSCADCVDLLAGKFQAGTDHLKTEATVLSTVGAAVLWIAIMSG